MAARFAVGVEKVAQAAQKQNGEAAVQLIEQAAPAPASPDGKGTRVDLHV